MNHLKLKTNLLISIVPLFFVLLTNCRVDPNPKGSLFDPRTPFGLLNSIISYDFLKNGSTRNWIGFSTAFASSNPSDTTSFDRLNQTTYALSVRSSNITSNIYSSADGLNYTQLGVTINNTNTNIFSAFNTRIQLSNYNTLDNGASWNANALVSGFCMVKDSGTSAYILGDNFVDRTIDSGNSINQITASPAYPSRFSSVCSYSNGKIYLVGGQKTNSYLYDLWESSDGINWSSVSLGVKPTSNSGFHRPCDIVNQSDTVGILGFVTSDVTEYRFHVVFNNLALLQSNDGKNWKCTNPSVNYQSEFTSITNRVVIIGNRLFVYGFSTNGLQNVYTNLE